MKKLSRVQRKRRRKKIFSTVSIIFILVFVVSIIILNTDFFSIKKITVLGNKKIPSNKIILFSSIEEGENIFKVSTRDAKKNIVTLPYVKNLEIKRKLPKEIIINIEERKEKIRIKDISSFIILDEEGYILDNIDSKNEKLTEIVGLNIKNKTNGKNAFVDNEDEEKVKFIRQMEELDMLSKIKYINIEDDSNINILSFDGIEVIFGTIDNIEYKLNMLDKVFQDIGKKELNVKMILMDKGDNPIVVLEDEEVEEDG